MKLKNLFINLAGLLFIVATFTYMVQTFDSNVANVGAYVSIAELAGDYGFSVMGIIFLIPAFVFSCITVSRSKGTTLFVKNIFVLFSSFFCLVSAVVTMFIVKNYIIPIVVVVCSGALLCFSICGISLAMKQEKYEKVEKEQEQESKEENN